MRFLSTPSARRATYVKYLSDKAYGFLSTPSARRATGTALPWNCSPADFYPRPPRGGRRRSGAAKLAARIFLSTPSARRATAASSRRWYRCRYFYPRPPRGGRRRYARRSHLPPGDFYPRPPRGGRQLWVAGARERRTDFYPRPPRGGRPTHAPTSTCWQNFYPRPPRGGRRFSLNRITSRKKISIHALREEGDFRW